MQMQSSSDGDDHHHPLQGQNNSSCTNMLLQHQQHDYSFLKPQPRPHHPLIMQSHLHSRPSSTQHHHHHHHQYHQQQQQTLHQSHPHPAAAVSESETSISTSIDSTAQTGRADIGADWQEEAYQKIKAMKEAYLPKVNYMYHKLTAKLKQYDNLPQQHPKSERIDKLKKLKTMLERLRSSLSVTKDKISPAFKDNLSLYEKQLIYFMNYYDPRKQGQGQGHFPPSHPHEQQHPQPQIINHWTQSHDHNPMAMDYPPPQLQSINLPVVQQPNNTMTNNIMHQKKSLSSSSSAPWVSSSTQVQQPGSSLGSGQENMWSRQSGSSVVQQQQNMTLMLQQQQQQCTHSSLPMVMPEESEKPANANANANASVNATDDLSFCSRPKPDIIADQPPIERLIKTVGSMSRVALASCVSDIASVTMMADMIAVSPPGNGSSEASAIFGYEDLAPITNSSRLQLQIQRLQQQQQHDHEQGTKRMMRRCFDVTSTPLTIVAFNQQTDHHSHTTSDLDSYYTTVVKRPRTST